MQYAEPVACLMLARAVSRGPQFACLAAAKEVGHGEQEKTARAEIVLVDRSGTNSGEISQPSDMPRRCQPPRLGKCLPLFGLHSDACDRAPSWPPKTIQMILDDRDQGPDHDVTKRQTNSPNTGESPSAGNSTAPRWARDVGRR